MIQLELTQLWDASEGWTAPSAFPALPHGPVTVDCETTGLGNADVPVGCAVRSPSGECWYFPWGHPSGNLDKETVLRWLRDQLADRDVCNLNIKFDVKMLRRVGVDLEKLGCRLHEVQHPYALLYGEERRSFSLDSLAKDFLGEAKVELPSKNIAQLPARVVGPYAEADVSLAWRLWEKAQPDIAAKGLSKVLELEDSLLYATLHMEERGLRLDMEKLHRWEDEIASSYKDRIMGIWGETKLKVNPNSQLSLVKLFDHEGIAAPASETGGVTFAEEQLKKIAAGNPRVRMALEARQFSNLLSKYVGKYKKAQYKGRLHYQLHQLRGNEYGTVSGRFSSSNVNIQQVYAVEKQEEATLAWPIRELFISDVGCDFCAADASQIEFRIFAHYSKSEALIKRYNEDPTTDFHHAVTDLINQYVPMKRKLVKNVNFMKVYGGGTKKLMAMTGMTAEQAAEADEAYGRMFPEIGRLSRLAMTTAERRGDVKTYLGRIANFSKKERLHSALNRVIQGTAADYFKLKMLEVYNERVTTGFEPLAPVHDELCGNIEPGDKPLARLKELLAEQSIKFSVPITWNVKTGRSWNL